MKTLRIWNVRPIVGRVMLGLVLAALFGSMSAVTAHSDDRRGYERHNNGRSEYRGRDYDHDRRYRGRGHRTTVYRERVYVEPPPVVYAPPEPVGLRIFLPPIIFR